MADGITHAAWKARYGVPCLVAPPFRDDPPPGCARMPLWRVFDRPDAETFCITSATAAEVERSQMRGCGLAGVTFCRLSRLWGCDAGGQRFIGSMIVAVSTSGIETFNELADRDLAWLWRQCVWLGQEPELEPLVRQGDGAENR